MKGRVFIALALLSAPVGSGASGNETVNFAVGDVKFTAVAPEGYCVPKGEDELFAAEVATQDSSSFTSLTLIRCDLAGEERGYGDGVDFIVFKTPFRMLSVIKPREELLRSLSSQMGKPDWEINGEMDGAVNQVADTLSRNFATAVSVEGTIRPRGVDSFCAYLGGKLTVASEDVGGSGLMGSCVTSIDGKVMTVHSYGPADGSQNVENLMRRSRAVALSVRRVAP